MPEGPAPSIFISYRRQETKHLAGRLADHLAQRFGESRVFMDIDSIGPGEDFVTEIEVAVGQCDVLLAIIGPDWSTIEDDEGARRLDDPNDFVVLEVGAALDRKIPVIPILADGAPMPRAEELPSQLAGLTRHNAVRLDVISFRRSVDWLEQQLAEMVEVASTTPSTHRDEASKGDNLRHWSLLEVDRRSALRFAGGALILTTASVGILQAIRLMSSLGTPDPWLFETGDEVFSSPTVLDGIVYVGSSDQNVYAIDAVTGTEQWQYPTDGAITSTPAIANGLVAVGANDSRVHAIDATSGSRRWIFAGGAAFHSSPTIVNGVVYIGCRDNNVYAIDSSTGVEKWRFSGGDWFNSSPTVVDGVVYIGCRDHEVYALDAETGDKRWSFTTESTVDSSAFVSGGTVWIGSDDRNVYALSTDGGSHVWQFTTDGGVVSTPIVQDRVLYVGSDDGNLYALDATTGRKRWQSPTENQIRSSPALTNNLVLIGSRDRHLYGIDRVSGDRQWRYATGAPIDDSSPCVVDGLAYIASLDHRVYAIVAATGVGPSLDTDG